MKVIFDKEDVKIDGRVIFNYEEISKEDGYKKIYDLLKECVKGPGRVTFFTTEECPPFGKRLKSIISAEFLTEE